MGSPSGALLELQLYSPQAESSLYGSSIDRDHPSTALRMRWAARLVYSESYQFYTPQADCRYAGLSGRCHPQFVYYGCPYYTRLWTVPLSTLYATHKDVGFIMQDVIVVEREEVGGVRLPGSCSCGQVPLSAVLSAVGHNGLAPPRHIANKRYRPYI